MANKFMDGLKGVLGAVAPTLGAAFGGPLGGTAGMMLKRKLLGKEEATDEELAAVVTAGAPETVVKIREIEIEFQKFLEENNLKVMEMDAEDRANARAREIALKDWTPTALAMAVTCGFFGVILWILKWGMPTEGEQVLTLMLGSLGTAWIGIVNYYYGSSSGSRSKSATIDAMAAKK